MRSAKHVFFKCIRVVVLHKALPLASVDIKILFIGKGVPRSHDCHADILLRFSGCFSKLLPVCVRQSEIAVNIDVTHLCTWLLCKCAHLEIVLFGAVLVKIYTVL